MSLDSLCLSACFRTSPWGMWALAVKQWTRHLLSSESEPIWHLLKANMSLINIWKYLLRSNTRVRFPFLSPCDVWGVTQRYSRGGDSMCWNVWWQGFHPTHWGLFVVILGSLMGAVWESSRQTGSHHCTHTHTCIYAHAHALTNRHLHIQKNKIMTCSLPCQSNWRFSGGEGYH